MMENKILDNSPPCLPAVSNKNLLPKQSKPALSKKEINIFIVDDSDIFSYALKKTIETAFSAENIMVYLFETGESCMKDFARLKPLIVVLDYNLNSNYSHAANGIKVLDWIKKENSKTNVIMLTGDDHLDVALTSFHHGVFDYVVKTECHFEKINSSIFRIFTLNKLALHNEAKEKKTIEQLIARKELDFQNREKEKRNEELIISTGKLDLQNKERTRLVAELLTVNFQKNEIEKSRRITEEKNKDIIDSINYAQRIQMAKLPGKEEIYASFPQSFVLFKPKDIVSGDFYFLRQNERSVIIGAADCTGHGVPGAFMSMIGSEKLEEAFAHSSNTSEILNHLNRGIKSSLHQSESTESTRDGMDIGICCIDPEKRIVKYAGANRPLWIIRNGKKEVEVIKGTKKAIGGLTEDKQYFESNELKLNEGDTLYLTTDGYADQFGVENGKKLMIKKFKEILLNIQNKSMHEQKQFLENFIENWKEGIEQIDDILVIGIRL